MLKKLHSRKGFTMVELIVVLGVIGVLIAMIVPMTMNAGKPQEAAAKAKAFYYATQNIFIDFKAENADTMTEGFYTFDKNGATLKASNGEYIYIVAHATPTDGFTEVKVAKSDKTVHADSAEGYVSLEDAVDDTNDLRDKLNQYGTGDEYGYYYALIDSQCRVQVCYWSQEEISVLSDNSSGAFSKSTIDFTDNDYIDHSVVGSFPTEYSAFECVMFKDYEN